MTVQDEFPVDLVFFQAPFVAKLPQCDPNLRAASRGEQICAQDLVLALQSAKKYRYGAKWVPLVRMDYKAKEGPRKRDGSLKL